MSATTSRKARLTTGQIIQVHNYLQSRRNDFATNPPTYTELLASLASVYDIRIAEPALRRLLRETGLKCRVDRNLLDPVSAAARKAKRREVLRRNVESGKMRPFTSNDPRHHGLRILSDAQIQEACQAYNTAYQQGLRFDLNGWAAKLDTTSMTLRRNMNLSELLCTRTLSTRRPKFHTQNGRPEEIPTTHRDRPIANPYNQPAEEFSFLRKKIEALISAHDTDRTIMLRLVQENGVLAGLIRGIISGIDGLYKGLDVPYMSQPQDLPTVHTETKDVVQRSLEPQLS